MSADTPDGVTLLGLKYAELLGRPLSKSLYRQLPLHEDHCCVNVDDSHEAFCWEPALTLQGKINWCPPGCEAETGCACESDQQCRERRDPRCRRQRPHQHLLLSVNGSLYRGFVYLRFIQYEDYPARESLCELMNPLQEEASRLRREQYTRKSSPDGWRQTQQNQECSSRLAVIDKTVKQYDGTARRELHQWLESALATLPVILLRG